MSIKKKQKFSKKNTENLYKRKQKSLYIFRIIAHSLKNLIFEITKKWTFGFPFYQHFDLILN